MTNATMDSVQARLADNPFPGLRAFNPDEAAVFFGRQRQVDDLLLKLAQVPLVAVSGASGCGKSSLVLAGLLDALANGRGGHYDDGEEDVPLQWRPVVMRPGSAPIANLAAPLAEALAAAQAATTSAPGPAPSPEAQAERVASLQGRLRLGSAALSEAVRLANLPAAVRVLVIVDQFEELFRYRRITDVDECSAFVKLLLQAASDPAVPVRVVLTMRSDSLGFCADFRDLPEAVSRGQFLVPRLTREQRKQAIVGPVLERGFEIAPRLVQRVLNDVSDDFDDLPVMQHVMARTWQRWAADCQGSRAIDLEDYLAVGTAREALSRHADEALESLSGLAPVVERVLKALTERVAGSGSEVRRPLPLSQLCRVTGDPPEQVREVVERYRRGDTVLLLPAPTVALDGGVDRVIDISHESLIRVWTRLQGWAESEAQSAQMFRRIDDAAQMVRQGDGAAANVDQEHEHEKDRDQDRDEVMRGQALQFALTWRENQRPNADWAALYRPGFERAMAFLDRSREVWQAELAGTARRRRRRRVFAGSVVLGIAAFGTTMAFLWHDARQSDQTARQLKSTADQQAISRKLAFAANAMFESGALDTALLLGSGALQRGQNADEAQEIMRRILLDAPRRMLRGPGVDDGSGPVSEGLAVPKQKEITGLGFNADGSQLLATSWGGSLVVWDTERGMALSAVERNTDGRAQLAAAWSGDGKLLVSPDRDGMVAVQLAVPAAALTGPTPASSAASAAAGSAAVGAPNAAAPAIKVMLEDISPGILRSATDTDQPNGAIDATHGRYAASELGFGLRLWDMRSGRLLGSLPVSAALGGLLFSPDGQTLAVALRGGGALLWDVPDAKPAATGRPLRGLRQSPARMAFSADGQTLATSDAERPLVLWDVSRAQSLRALAGKAKAEAYTTLAFNIEGRTLAAGDREGNVTVWKLDEARPAPNVTAAHAGVVGSLAFGPDDRTLASGGPDGTIALWDSGERDPLPRHLKAGRSAVNRLAFSADGNTLASAGADGVLMLWDTASAGVRHGNFSPGLDAMTALAFDPRGQRLAMAGEDASVWMWDVARGRPLGEALRGHDQAVWSVAFSPDGHYMASGSDDTTIVLWDADLRIPQAIGAPLKGHIERVFALAFSQDGQWLASGGVDKRVILWNLKTREPRLLPLVHGRDVTGVAFSPDGQRLASIDRGHHLILWDVARGTPIGKPLPAAAAAGKLGAVAFSPDGRLIAFTGRDGQIEFADGHTGQVDNRALDNQQVPITSIAFGDNGRLLVSGDAEGAVRLWDVNERKPSSEAFVGHTDSIYGVAIRPDGKTVASVAADRRLIVWDADLSSWAYRACSSVNRDIRRAEWPRQFTRGSAQPSPICASNK